MAPRFFVVLATVSLTLCLAGGGLAQNAKPVLDDPDLIAADQLYKAGKFAEAADKYQALLKIDPKLVATEAGLIEALLRQQKIDDASAEADKALSAQPSSATLLAAMGDVQFRLAQMTEAEASYHKGCKSTRGKWMPMLVWLVFTAPTRSIAILTTR
jgi:tetratricopeptide (TPR) repeat protein